MFTVLRAASRNGKTISTFGLVSPWSLSSLGEDEGHAVSSKNCFSLVQWPVNLQVTLALFSSMSKFGIVLEHTGTSSEVKVYTKTT